ncbi:hypothetical protein FOCC_FOCC005310 [Frankliniella occidentalis]|nr:hypothetical protein FOCC_FOCC005310 [Frankliniella occidentalis]
MRYSEASLKNEVFKRRSVFDHSKKNHVKKNLLVKAFTEIAQLYSDDEVDGEYRPVPAVRSSHSKVSLKTVLGKRVEKTDGEPFQANPQATRELQEWGPGGDRPHNYQADDMAWLDDVGQDLSQWHESNIFPNPDTTSITFAADNRVSPSVFNVILFIERNGDGQAQVEDCSAAVQREFDRRQEEAALRRPPQAAAGPSATSSPASSVARRGRGRHVVPAVPLLPNSPRLVASPGGTSRARDVPPPSSATTRSPRVRRNKRAPNRYSPQGSQQRPTRRQLDLSVASTISATSVRSVDSDASQQSIRSETTRRRRRRASNFEVNPLLLEELSIIHEMETVVEAENDNEHGGVQPRQAQQGDGDALRPQGPQEALVDQQLVRSPMHHRPAPPEGGDTRPNTSGTESPRRPPGEGRLRFGTPASTHGSPGQRGRGRIGTPSCFVSPEPAVGQDGRGGGSGRRQGDLDEADMQHRQWQINHERHRQGLRDNIRIQTAARQADLQQQEQRPAGLPAAQAGAENVEVAVLRQFLLERDGDVYSYFGKIISCLLKQLPPDASGRWMLHNFGELVHLSGLNAEELDNFFNGGDDAPPE